MPADMSDFIMISPDDYDRNPVLMLRVLVNVLHQRARFPYLLRYGLESIAHIALNNGLDGMMKLVENIDQAGPSQLNLEKHGKRRHRHGSMIPSFRSWREKAIPALIAHLETLESEQINPRHFIALEQNLRLAAKVLGLDNIEADILLISLMVDANYSFSQFFDRIFSLAGGFGETLAAMLGHTPREIQERISPTANLFRHGIVRLATSVNSAPSLDVLPAFETAVAHDLNDETAFIERLIGMPVEATLTGDDFPHLSDALLKLTCLLRSAITTGEQGVNILLYGRPGTGKTEFAKLLAAGTHLPLFPAGLTGRMGSEPSRRDRLDSYLLFQHVMSGGERLGLCLFDEADDIFDTGGPFNFRPQGSKLFTNEMFENNAIPTIWIINDEGDLPQSILRRLSFALHIDLPPVHVRSTILGKLCAKKGIGISTAEVAGLAARYPVPPAVYAKAITSTDLMHGLMHGAAGTANDVLDGLCEAMGVATAARPGAFAEMPFRADLNQADTDLVAFSAQLSNASGAGFSLCLYGVSGTGKSAYATHIAAQLGMEVETVRASDILGPYVGQSEANLRALFKKSARNKTFLIIDEADSLLQNRQNARQNWEVSLVNELLVAMEQHPLPFACTTNLKDRLDPASLRRFTFSICFETLPISKARACFQHYFGAEAPASMAMMSGLVPADFAVVKRRAEIVGGGDNLEALVSMLGDELHKRGDGNPAKIGFRAPSQVLEVMN